MEFRLREAAKNLQPADISRRGKSMNYEQQCTIEQQLMQRKTTEQIALNLKRDLRPEKIN